jgi:hypothetical protein
MEYFRGVRGRGSEKGEEELCDIYIICLVNTFGESSNVERAITSYGVNEKLM